MQQIDNGKGWFLLKCGVSKMDNAKILIVEANGIIALAYEMKLESQGYDVVAIASTGEQALELVESTKPDLILTGNVLKGKLDGNETAAQIHSHHNIPIIFITGNIDLKNGKRLMAAEPAAVIMKPVDNAELLKEVKRALQQA